MRKLYTAYMMLLCSGMLAACGGGFVVRPPPETNIMSIRNTTTLALKTDTSAYEAHPIPILPSSELSKILSRSYRLVPQFVPGISNGQAIEAKAIGEVTYPDINTPPFDRFARLTFLENEKGFVCSSEFVGNSLDVVMTAAHCVYSNGTNTWNRNWIVAPKYDQGSSLPLLDWDCAAIYSGWAQGGWPYDYAFIRVRGSHANALGLRGDVMPGQWKSAGFPSLYGGTQRLAAVDGTNGGGGGGIVKMTNNPMGKGSSGGAWLDNSVAIGLNSFYFDNDLNSMWGPQFDTKTIALYEYVRRGCTDNEVPSNTPARSRDVEQKVVIEVGKVVARSPELVHVADSACTCQNSLMAQLKNPTFNRYTAKYAKLSYGEALSPSVSESYTTELLPGENRALQCTVEASPSGKCDKKTSIRLQATRRIASTADITGVIGVRTVSPAHCAEMCSDSAPTGYCLGLGSSAQPIVKSLGAFVSDVLNKGSTSNVVATIDEMTLAFQGDPSKVGNPCGRSAFSRVQDTISNDGMECKVTTAPLDPSPQAMRISLGNPTQTRATRIANKVTINSVTMATFSEKSNSPVLEFSGPASADDLNALFGGTVVAIERTNGRIVVTTENGCVKEDE